MQHAYAHTRDGIGSNSANPARMAPGCPRKGVQGLRGVNLVSRKVNGPCRAILGLKRIEAPGDCFPGSLDMAV